MSKRSSGFTVIEILFAALLLGAASIVFFVQKHDIQVSGRDDTRKIAINAMYYGLEKVYFPAHGYYPAAISSDILPSVDPSLFTDPNNIKLGTAGSNYTYTPTNCTDNQCHSYTLRSTLENEADYVKSNSN